MGLDMYLYGTLDGSSDRYTDEGEENPSAKEMGYWRKHPNLHGFFVRTFAFNVDDCEPIELNQTALDLTIEAIQKNELPHTTGFFFGASPTTTDLTGQPLSYVAEQIEFDVLTMQKAKQWLQDNPTGKIFYQASW